MFLKLSLMVLVLGGTACGLLVLRQQELDLLAAQTDLRRRIAHNEQVLQALRWEIDTLSNDERLRDWMEIQNLSLVPLDLDVTAARYAAHRQRSVTLGQNHSPSQGTGG